MNYKALHIYTVDPAQRDLLTGLLAEKGFSGFEETVDRLIAFIDEPAFPPGNELTQWLTERQLRFEIKDIADANWNAIWESGYSPVQIGGFCTIRANFHPPAGNTAYDIVITPRTTFGTGHHSTTASVIRLMEDLDLKDKFVLDFGTGTGILAILASKMGASKIWAVDNDPNAVNNARDNAEENRSTEIIFVHADTPDPGWGRFDCILVNIHLQVILTHLNLLTQMLKPGGILLFSGILEHDYPVLAEQLEQNKYAFVKDLVENKWVAGMWKKR